MKKKTINFEALASAMLLNYKTTLTSDDMVRYMAEIKYYLGHNYVFKDSELNHIKDLVSYDGSTIALLYDFNHEMPDGRNVGITLRYATNEDLLNYVNFISKKCCTTCTNPTCIVPSCEKYGVDELGNPQGQICIGYENEGIKVFKKTQTK